MPIEDIVPFIPIGIELDAALLHQDAVEIFRGIKALPADVRAHDGRLVSGFIENARLEAEAKVFVEPRAQIALTLRLEKVVKGAHLGLVIRAGADLFRRGNAKLTVT